MTRDAVSAMTLLALARGVLVGHSGCNCRICGPSPFGVAGDAAPIIGPMFSEHQLLAGASPLICEGCRSLLAGLPSRTNPPLRMISVAVVGGRLERLDRAGMWAHLMQPRAQVLSWAVSGQKHHWLRAGLCSRDHLTIGTDTEPIEYRPVRDMPVLEAIAEMVRGGFARKAIQAGDYHPSAVARFGISRWAQLERVVSSARGSLLIDLACWCAPGPDDGSPAAPDGEVVMLDRGTQLAVRLVTHLARASDVRRSDGKMFWAGYFRHRIARFARLPLEACVSRLIGELRCSPMNGELSDVANNLAGMPAEMVAEVESALRERGDLVTVLAYEAIVAARKTEDVSCSS